KQKTQCVIPAGRDGTGKNVSAIGVLLITVVNWSRAVSAEIPANKLARLMRNYGNTEFLLDTRILVRGVPTLFPRLEVRIIACPQDKSPLSIRNTSMFLISKCRLIGSADSLILSVY